MKLSWKPSERASIARPAQLFIYPAGGTLQELQSVWLLGEDAEL